MQINAATRLLADWWSDLGPEGQEKYIKEHPHSDKAKQAGGSSETSYGIDKDGTIRDASGSKLGSVKIDEDANSIRIANIEVQEKGKGVGTSVIKQIQAEAAKKGKPVTLTTDAMRGKEAQEKQLRLYTRLGFVPNKGPDAVYEKIGKKKIYEALVWFPPK